MRASRLKILFLCTGNSCRSQMAEGFARALKSADIEAYSAGVAPQDLNRIAVKVMAESGIDISSYKSKHVEALRGTSFDYVVSVCDTASRDCPVWLGGGQRIHHPFDDPPRLAEKANTESEVLEAYRRVRDEIREFVETLPEYLKHL